MGRGTLPEEVSGEPVNITLSVTAGVRTSHGQTGGAGWTQLCVCVCVWRQGVGGVSVLHMQACSAAKCPAADRYLFTGWPRAAEANGTNTHSSGLHMTPCLFSLSGAQFTEMINFIKLINKEAQDSDRGANMGNKKILSGRETKQNFTTKPKCMSVDERYLFIF